MKTVLITGCNRGLGKYLMETFVANQYRVIACTRKPDEVFESYCKGLSSDILHCYFDLTDPDQINTALDALEEKDIEIDVLVNNAGTNNSVKPLLHVEWEDLEDTFRINYFAPVIVAKRISQIMMRQGHGSIVNVSSMMSYGHQPCGTCYDASKAALNQFVHTASQELAPFGIRVNAVACGIMEAGMSANLPEKAMSKLLKTVAMKRPATFDDIAQMVIFLASDNAAYITGAILPVDGGAVL
ncbi:MAG: SDR family oxidoreductase [Bacteroidales bacterium]|nr:SDR family oxidoreductase [Bacteroidales bacterium]